MTEDLKSDLQTVDGVGEATADALIDVLESGDYLGGDESESAYLQKAREAAQAGEYRKAAVYLQRDA